MNTHNDLLEHLLGRPVQKSLRTLLNEDNGDIRPCGGDFLNSCGLDVPSFFPEKATYLYMPLLGSGPFRVKDLLHAEKWGMPIAFVEDSFLRAATVFWDKSAAPILRRSVSLSCDTQGLYFDATRPSDLEDMIAYYDAPPQELLTAETLMKSIVSNRLSKYNNQPVVMPAIPGSKSREKILVIDQDYGDASIRLGQASDKTFWEMLEAALDENPGADILVKTHPDALVAGGRVGNLSSVRDNDRIHKITFPVNPYSILEQVSKTYVVTSTFGFESMMSGTPTVVFGMPWYAGWGVTEDRQKNPRRTKKMTLVELFNIFYCKYTRYANPFTRQPCDIAEAMDVLIALRQKL